MRKLSGRMKTLSSSVIAKADARDGMMAVVAVAAVAVSLAEILLRGKRRESRATSSGCKPDAFHHRLVAALSSIPVAAPAGVGK